MLKADSGMVYCLRPGCTGACPLTVALHKTNNGQPPCCRVCQRKFKIPQGAQRISNTVRGQRNDQPNPTTQRLVYEVASLKEQLADAVAPNNNAGGSKPSTTETAKPSLKQLQAAVDACKAAGISSTVAEDALAKAKEAEAGVTTLKSVLGKTAGAQATA